MNQAVLNYSLWTEHIAPAKVLYDALRREILTEESQTGGKAQNLGEAGAKRYVTPMRTRQTGISLSIWWHIMQEIQNGYSIS